LRDAKNSAEVRARLRAKLGFEIRVISGAEEAAYAFLSVQRGLPFIGQELLVIDIGGGSTEFIRGNDCGVFEAISIDVGSVRLTERYLHSDPVLADEVAAMSAAIDAALAGLRTRIANSGSPLTLIGIAGTFTTLAAIEKKLARYSHSEVHGTSLALAEVKRQMRLFQEMSVAQRKQIVGLEPKRADVIFAGACLVERIMNLFHADRLTVSDQGVRYGLLYEATKFV
jgi:exopolyphosphatase/guanosine-5'-triphosphate,3'-diphosphate pyrophosphatase